MSDLLFCARLCDTHYGVLYLFKNGLRQRALLWYNGPDFSDTDPISSNWLISRLSEADNERLLLQTMPPAAVQSDRAPSCPRPWRRRAHYDRRTKTPMHPYRRPPASLGRYSVSPIENTADEWFQSRMIHWRGLTEVNKGQPPTNRNRLQQ